MASFRAQDPHAEIQFQKSVHSVHLFLPKAETISMFWPYSDAQAQVGYNRLQVPLLGYAHVEPNVQPTYRSPRPLSKAVKRVTSWLRYQLPLAEMSPPEDLPNSLGRFGGTILLC